MSFAFNPAEEAGLFGTTYEHRATCDEPRVWDERRADGSSTWAWISFEPWQASYPPAPGDGVRETVGGD